MDRTKIEDDILDDYHKNLFHIKNLVLKRSKELSPTRGIQRQINSICSTLDDAMFHIEYVSEIRDEEKKEKERDSLLNQIALLEKFDINKALYKKDSVAERT